MTHLVNSTDGQQPIWLIQEKKKNHITIGNFKTFLWLNLHLLTFPRDLVIFC